MISSEMEPTLPVVRLTQPSESSLIIGCLEPPRALDPSGTCRKLQECYTAK